MRASAASSSGTTCWGSDAETHALAHGVGLHPIVVSCGNTREILAVLLRKGYAEGNTVADHIEVLGSPR